MMVRLAGRLLLISCVSNGTSASDAKLVHDDRESGCFMSADKRTRKTKDEKLLLSTTSRRGER